MSESLQNQLESLRKDMQPRKAEIIVPPIEETSIETEAEAPMKSVETGVEGYAVHGRGGTVMDFEQVQLKHETKKTPVNVPRKGDMFFDPATGAQQVIEGVRKEAGEPIVMFSKEVVPGVRAEQGRIQQMSLGRFEVQKQVGGYTEFSSREYNEIFDACQDVFEAINKVYREQAEVGDITPEAQDLMDRVGELSQEIGRIDDAWDALGTEATPTTIKEKHALIDRLKAVVTEFPEDLIQPHPTLRQIQSELNKSEQDDTVDEKKEKRGQREKREKKKVVSEEGRGTRQRGNVSGKGRARDMEALETVASGQRVENKRERRDDRSARGERPGIEFNTYQQSPEEVATLWEDPTIPLSTWIDTIRQQEADLKVVVKEIERMNGIAEWEAAIRTIDPELPRFALRTERDTVEKYLEELETVFTRKRGRESQVAKDEKQKKFEEARPRLREFLFRYHDILQMGERVIRELRERPVPKNERQSRVESPQLVQEGKKGEISEEVPFGDITLARKGNWREGDPEHNRESDRIRFGDIAADRGNRGPRPIAPHPYQARGIHKDRAFLAGVDAAQQDMNRTLARAGESETSREQRIRNQRKSSREKEPTSSRPASFELEPVTERQLVDRGIFDAVTQEMRGARETLEPFIETARDRLDAAGVPHPEQKQVIAETFAPQIEGHVLQLLDAAGVRLPDKERIAMTQKLLPHIPKRKH